MRLTPADVHNVAFSKPPIGKRGYNEDEVDQFLDFVEAELTRLINENSDLANRVEELESELAHAQAAGPPTVVVPTPAFSPPEPAPVFAAPEPARPVAGSEDDANSRAARVLALAQDTADRLTATARSESETVLTDARNRADAIVGEAQVKADGIMVDARHRSEAIMADAQTRAEAQLRQAAERSEAMEADAQRKHSEFQAMFSQQRSLLEGRIEQLKTYEREYRTRLKTYLESQLEELDQRGSAAPVDGGREAIAESGGYPGINQG